MILQFPLSYLVYYLPSIVAICLYTSIFTFGYLNRKKYHHSYGRYFMIAALFPITSSILFFAINRPFFLPTLYELNIPISLIYTIVLSVNILFMSLEITSAIFLFIAFYSLYKTHITQRAELKTT